MKRFLGASPFLIGACIVSVFFYKSLLFGQVPFPGDLLIAEYNPWKTYSFLGYAPGSYPNKAQYFDVLRQMYPWKTFSINEMKKGDFPLWNPHNFSGAPLFANFQSAVLYPLNIFYLFLSQSNAWTLLTMQQLLFCVLFTYFYARKIALSNIAAWFSAISFGFSSFLVVWLEYNIIGHVVLWLPLSLLAIEHLKEQISLRWIGVFLLSLVFALFAGHIQVFFYSLLFIFFYIFARARKLLWISLLIVLLTFGIGAAQLVPGFELISLSARSAHPYDLIINKILIQPWQTLMFFVSDFFGNPATRNYWPLDTYIGKVTSIGIVPLVFLPFIFLKRKESLVRFFAITAIIIVLLITRNPLTLLLYALPLPFVSSSAPTLATFLFCFSVSLLSGFGLDALRLHKWSFRNTIIFLAPVVSIFLLLWISVLIMKQFTLQEHVLVAIRNLLYATTIIAVSVSLLMIGLHKRQYLLPILIFLLCIHTVDSWRYFQKFTPFVPKSLVFPDVGITTFLQKQNGVDRFFGYGTAAIDANFATQVGLYSTDGYDPLYPKQYGEFMYATANGSIQKSFSAATRSDAVITPGYGKGQFMNNPYRLRIIDMLGVKYILDRVENGVGIETFPSDRFSILYDKDGWRVYENKKALPRAFVVANYAVYGSAEDFTEAFFSPTFNPEKTIFLEEKPDVQLENTTQPKNESTVIVSYEPNKVLIKTTTTDTRLLFLSDTYYPGWQAFVDDVQTKLYKANYTFRAVVVPKGVHTVSFTFSPSSFKIGSVISMLSIFAALLLFIVFYMQKKLKK